MVLEGTGQLLECFFFRILRGKYQPVLVILHKQKAIVRTLVPVAGLCMICCGVNRPFEAGRPVAKYVSAWQVGSQVFAAL